MLKITNKTVERDDNEGYTYTSYDVEGYAQLAGDSIWYEGGEQMNLKAKVTHIGVTEYDEGYRRIYVTHDRVWEIYTDTGFERSISEVLGFDVSFTEQGMQDDEMASME